MAQIQNNPFVEIMRSLVDELETMCQNLMIENLKRISHNKPIILSSVSSFRDTEEKNIYKGSMLIMNLIQRRADLA